MQITSEHIKCKLESLGKKVWQMSKPIQSINGSIRIAITRSLKTVDDLEKIEGENVAIFKVLHSKGIGEDLEPKEFNHLRYASWKNKT